MRHTCAERQTCTCTLQADRPRFLGALLCFQFEGYEHPSVACPQPRAIFDGQHRARAAARLLSSDDFEIRDVRPDAVDATGCRGGEGRHEDFQLVVEVYLVTSESQASRWALYQPQSGVGFSVNSTDADAASAAYVCTQAEM